MDKHLYILTLCLCWERSKIIPYRNLPSESSTINDINVALCDMNTRSNCAVGSRIGRRQFIPTHSHGFEISPVLFSSFILNRKRADDEK